MAQAVLGRDAPRSTGAFHLRPAQREAVRTAERALREFGGALIADAPGTGKTVLALAIAAQYDDVLVIAPAALREQWLNAAQRGGVSLRVETLEGLSHGRIPLTAPLIIVDEAHHLRTPTTARYRTVAQLAMHQRLLLLTATPVVNSLRDRDALLALFLGERAVSMSESTRAAVILRLASTTSASDAVHQLPALRSAPDVAELAEALAHLPPPLPLADGAQATAIVRLTLAFSWASSLAALDVALKRRIERGRTLDDQLAAGHWPSRYALRAWILGDDATQLAFGFNLASETQIPLGARATLAAHLSAVRAVRALIKPHVERDTTQRAQSLKMLLNDYAPRRVVVLAQSAVTVRALYAALRAEPGVVAITGNRVHAAAGRWTRDEVLRALGPSAAAFDARDRRGIRLLIATDILAEGVELQGASVLVHADPTWTPARLEQRVGRVAREGQREQVLVTQFAIPAAADALLQMRDRLQRKSAARVTALRIAHNESELRTRLHSWLRLGPATEHSPRVAAVRAAHCGFVALLQNGEAFQLVSGEHREGRWRVRDSPRALLRVLPDGAATPERMTIAQLSTVRRVLQRWHRTRQARSAIGDQAALPDSIIRALRHRLEGEIVQASLSQRSRSAQQVGELLAAVSALRGRGAELALKRLLRQSSTSAELTEQLRTLSCDREAATHQRPVPQAGAGRLRLAALLLLVPASSQQIRSGATVP